jgi:D-amino-acid dehydrogenase
MSEQTVIVLGAGMVGVCTALALQRRGATVTLLDRSEPGQETSFGNAGVLAHSSLVPINNPSLWANLPYLIRNKSASLRYDPLFVMRNLPWMAHFFASARKSKCVRTAAALNGLISYSIDTHLSLIAELGLQDYLSDQGWMFLYRSRRSFETAGPNRLLMAHHGVEFETLGPDSLRQLEPGLRSIFPAAVWFKGSYSINNPGAVVGAYANAFVDAGGEIRQAEALTLSESEEAVKLTLTDGTELSADRIAVCLGPWAKAFLKRAGYDVQMAFERGYHRHFTGRASNSNALGLGRPICDTGGGYVIAPMQAGLRLTSGVELTYQNAPANTRQIEQAERAARQALELGDRVDDRTWLGSRPTFPDSRPAIGMAPGSRRVAVGIGHQHIGLASGAGTGKMLADFLCGRDCEIDATPFRPDRYIRRC